MTSAVMNSERSGHEHTTCLCVSDGRSAWLIGWLTGLVTMVIVSSLLLQQSNSSIALILFFFSPVHRALPVHVSRPVVRLLLHHQHEDVSLLY